MEGSSRIVQEKDGGCLNGNPDPGSFSPSKTVTWSKLNCRIFANLKICIFANLKIDKGENSIYSSRIG